MLLMKIPYVGWWPKEKGYAKEDIDGSSKDRFQGAQLSENLSQDRLEWRYRVHADKQTKLWQGFDDDDMITPCTTVLVIGRKTPFGMTFGLVKPL